MLYKYKYRYTYRYNVSAANLTWYQYKNESNDSIIKFNAQKQGLHEFALAIDHWSFGYRGCSCSNINEIRSAPFAAVFLFGALFLFLSFEN